MLAQALALNWDDQEFTEVRPGIFGATINTAQLTVTIYRYEPGCAWETHQHAEDQITFIAEGGVVDFVVDGQPTPLGAGQLAVIPGNIPHSATIPDDGERVVSVNVWTLRTPPAART
jgi:quercetin dioxygenase-like cupin family protein